jgi:5-formyltetrahydrofolate cyclo-ligase
LPLKKKKFNIYEPNNSFLKFKIKLDLAIVPIVGFDKDFRRIGFGAGYYDRFFGLLKYKPTIIFTQICKCYCKKTITQTHDIKADYIITNRYYKGINTL